MLKKLIQRVLLACAFLCLLAVTAVVGITWWEMPPKSTRDFYSLRMAWDGENNKVPKEERLARDRQYIERCLALAEKYPDTAAELAALTLADKRAENMPERRPISERLRARIKTAKFDHLVTTSGYGMPGSISSDIAAPEYFARVKQNLDHPKAAWVVAAAGAAMASGSEANEPPPQFREVADLIVSRFAESRDVTNFCSVLGNGSFSPHWANQFEDHVKQILKVNKDRFVRCSASVALAEIAHSSTERQAEAEQKYRAILKEFDGKTPYHAQGIEQLYGHNVQARLESMQFAPIGKPAPEIASVDLDGNPMTLSEYRGKVVLVTFWATWCGPCMKLVAHERELAQRYADEPFAIVGVNADIDPADGVKAATEKAITWRSFRDKREGAPAISDDWQALFPTVYLIDHQGIVRQRFCGNPTPDVLQRSVKELVSAAKAG
jgi:thiol-disulfide isomerase/thioredoxin